MHDPTDLCATVGRSTQPEFARFLWWKSLQDTDHFLIRNLTKITIIEADRSEHLVILETDDVVGLLTQFRKALGGCNGYREYEPLRIVHAGGAQSRACRCARCNTVVDYNRSVAG